MKKFFMFAAMASVALASCVKNEPVATVEQGDAILFNSPVVAPATKADPVAYAFPYDSFNAYAWWSANDYAGNGTLYLEDRTFAPVTVDEVTYWKTNNAYWPKTGKLTFVGYAPVTGPTDVDCEADALSFSYTVIDAIGNQQDVLYSAWVANKTSADQTANAVAGATGVEIPFHHALSAVKFVMKAANDAVAPKLKITDITLTGVEKTATLTVPFDGTPSWSVPTVAGNYTVLAGGTDAFVDAETAVDLNQGTQFILMPQNVSDAVLNVSYEMLGDGGWIDQTSTVNMTGTWEMGKRYTYTLIFNLDEIKLAPVVAEDWTDVTPGTNLEKVL